MVSDEYYIVGVVFCIVGISFLFKICAILHVG